jgi:hypothetical protein
MKVKRVVFRAKAERIFIPSVVVCSLVLLALVVVVFSDANLGQAGLTLCLFLIIAFFTWPIQYELSADRMHWRIGIAINRSVAFSEIDRIVP